MAELGQEPFVSGYSWLIAPGDHLQPDYETPTKLSTWMQTSAVNFEQADKRVLYGQWIAQLLQCKLNIKLAELYQKSGEKEWPISLRYDAVEALEEYFNRHKPSETSSAATSST